MHARRFGAWGCAAISIGLGLAAAGCTQAKRPTPVAAVSWVTSMGAGLKDAAAKHRPMLVDFYTDWCVYCKQLDESTYVDPRFIEFSKRFTMVKLNAEVDTATASRYRILYYPTILTLKEDGTEIDRFAGYYPTAGFVAQVEDFLAGRNTLAGMLAQESVKGTDATYLYDLAERLATAGRTGEARQRWVRLVTVDSKNTSGKVDDALYSLSRMSRKEKNYQAARAYAQEIVDRYPTSDMMKPALLQVAINWRRSGDLAKARRIFLDYGSRFPDDEDAPYAREQADSIAAEMAMAHRPGA
jgi:thiol-disulfide isomerase/thioredoxin